MFESTRIRLRIDRNVRPYELVEYESTGEQDSSLIRSQVTFTVSIIGIDGELQEAEFKLSEDKFRACLHGGGGPQVGEVTRSGGVTACTYV